MPKSKTILQNQHAYHITARCINREWFNLDIEKVWRIFSDYLYFLHHAYNFEIHAFVLMNNHFHGIFSTPECNISDGMNYFMRETSRSITYQSDRINQTYGGPYHWCLLDSYYYFLNAYKYVYRNPVQANLSENCESYRYSSLNGLIGLSPLPFPVQEDTLLFNPKLDLSTLRWINTSKLEDSLEVQKALRKHTFRFEKINATGKPARDETFIF